MASFQRDNIMVLFERSRGGALEHTMKSSITGHKSATLDSKATLDEDDDVKEPIFAEKTLRQVHSQPGPVGEAETGDVRNEEQATEGSSRPQLTSRSPPAADALKRPSPTIGQNNELVHADVPVRLKKIKPAPVVDTHDSIKGMTCACGSLAIVQMWIPLLSGLWDIPSSQVGWSWYGPCRRLSRSTRYSALALFS